MYSNPSVRSSTILIDACLLLATAILVIIAVAWSSFATYSIYLSLLLLILLGIPHGAIDHLVDLSQKASNSNSTLQFYLRYLLLMCGMALVWYFSAPIALLMFLAISAFHFGQSQWHQFGKMNPLSLGMYFTWGALIISIVVFFNLDQCVAIVNSIGGNFSYFTHQFWLLTLLISSGLAVILLTYIGWTKQISRRQIFTEILFVLFLLLLSISTDALFAFAVYFGIWHSFKSLILEYKHLSGTIKTPKNFIVQLIPYTLLSLIGLLVAYWVIQIYLPDISFYMVLFVLISMLSVPHLMVMHPLYESTK